MKKILLLTAAFSVMLTLGVSCSDDDDVLNEDDQENVDPDNGENTGDKDEPDNPDTSDEQDESETVTVSFAEASRNAQHTMNLVVRDGSASTTVQVALSQSLSSSLTVGIGTDSGFVSEYNSANGTSYTELQSTYYKYDSSVSIAAGATSASVSVTVSNFTSEGSYCIPLKISSVSDNSVEIEEDNYRILFLLISSSGGQSVPTIDYTILPNANGNWSVSTSNWTLEGWVWIDGFEINNQAIFTGTCSPSTYGTEIYVRFGDEGIDYNCLQIKTNGSSFNSNMRFETETWYHIAFVQSNNTLALYVNGEQDFSTTNRNTRGYRISNLELCASGEEYFWANAKLAQIRFWSVARTADELKEGMSGDVDPDSEGLFGYWKLDEGEGGTFYDSTSNGYDMTCAVAPTWETVVDFSNPNN